jgi:hypothetical protein
MVWLGMFGLGSRSSDLDLSAHLCWCCCVVVVDGVFARAP